MNSKYFNLKDCRRCLLYLIAALFLFSAPAKGQQDDGREYELIPAPDLWYNDVDGIRVGIRLRGQKPGTFQDGPHRLNLGAWIGTWNPDHPVSYYFSFTEPIPSISEFGSEGSVRLMSQYRTGLHRHGIALDKRWQQGFDERHYKELSVKIYAQQRFENEYLQFPGLWQDRWLYLVSGSATLREENSIGTYSVQTVGIANVAGSRDFFVNGKTAIQQIVPLGSNFVLNGRLFIGVSSDLTPPEYMFIPGIQSPVNWEEKGLTRAKGTIPGPWLESGVIQIAGGPNLRGYNDQNIEDLKQGIFPLFSSFGSLNIELDYPNPLDGVFNKIPVIGELITFRSYIFMDSGTSLGLRDIEDQRVLSDAGAGFTFNLNIPDYLNKPRGLYVRYDIPVWVSEPGGGNQLSYRSVVGIGAIINI